MKLADGAKLYVDDNTNYPYYIKMKNVRYIRNLFMSIEYCQLPRPPLIPSGAWTTILQFKW